MSFFPKHGKSQIFLMLLNGDGTAKSIYKWGRKRADINSPWTYGWIDEDSNLVGNDVIFKAGQGFWVQNDGTEANDFTLILPGVEL